MRVCDTTVGSEQDEDEDEASRPQVPPHHTRADAVRRRDRRTRLCVARR